MSEARNGRRIPLAPSEGWLTLLLVVFLVLTVAWSIDDAEWVLGRDRLTDFLAWLVVPSVLWGFVGGKVGWSRPTTYVLGAVVGALVVPIVAGYVLVPDADSIGGWFRAIADASVNAYLDLAWRNKVLTQEYGHFMLALGLLVWATGMFAGYATFGRHRPVSAVIVTGLVLLLDMALTERDQLTLLVAFTVAALLILVRHHATDERTTWVRRRLGDPAGVSSLYLRGGTAFAVLAIVGSLFLTSTASSAPLAGVWSDAGQQLIELTQGLQRYLPRGGGTRITGVSFGPQTAITGRWVTDTTPAVRIRLPADDLAPYYWRAVAYDRFDLSGWSLTDALTVDRTAGSNVLAETAEDPPTPDSRRELAFSVEPLEFRGSSIFSPDAPRTVDRPTRLTLVGPGEYFGALESAGGGGPYRVTALIPVIGDETAGGLTENRLRAAGQGYPERVRSLYLAVPEGSLGPDSLALLETIRKLSPLNDPYDLARTAEQYLRSGRFSYSTDVAGLDCGDRSVVECFAHFRQGYCQYYASTMAILLRSAGIPTRLVQGFLPGERDPGTGVEVVRYSNSHAWVEVYFPGFGWVPFDPTGGGVAQLAPLPSGAPVPVSTASVGPAFSASPRGLEGDETIRPGGGGGGSTRSGTGSGPYIAIALLLAIAVGLLAFLAYRQGPRGPLSADLVFGSVSRLAARLGFARRPTETVYEYAGSLAELVPSARPELETVAHAKVEVSYGHRELGPDRLRVLQEAQRRLRVALLRLVVRRARRTRRG